MTSISNFIGLFGASLLVVWFISMLVFTIPKIRNSKAIKKLYFVIILLLVIMFAPIMRFHIDYYIRGIVSDLSITTILLLISFIYNEIVDEDKCYNMSYVILIPVILVDLVLCFSALGCFKFDLYSVGMHPSYLLIVYLVAQLIFWKYSKKFVFLWIIALVFFIFKLQLSHNLWDYLMDPILFLVFIGLLIRRLIRRKDLWYRG